MKIRGDRNWDWTGFASLILSYWITETIWSSDRARARIHIYPFRSTSRSRLCFLYFILLRLQSHLVILNRSRWKFTRWRTLVIHYTSYRLVIFCYIQHATNSLYSAIFNKFPIRYIRLYSTCFYWSYLLYVQNRKSYCQAEYKKIIIE